MTTRLSTFLLATAVVVTPVLAQSNDDCGGAIQIVQGTNGPFDNTNATLSSQPWPCGFGDLDLWFFYVAPGTGTLDLDTCGAGFDTQVEVFTGTCGGLTSIACNDDACGLQSQLSLAVTVGTTYYVRVGGYDDFEYGPFTIQVNGPAASGSVATATSVGAGCAGTGGYASFYEFLPAANFDLANTAFEMIGLQPGYFVIGNGTFVAPSTAAVALTLGDDDEVVQALTVPFPYDGGVANTLNICSNGYVSVDSNGDDFFPTVGAMLSAPATGWWVWHDFNVTEAGSGQVMFEEIGGVAYITWDGVYDFGGAGPADASTFQFQFDGNTGGVTVVFQSVSTLSASDTDFLVGYSPGGASLTPPAKDLSIDTIAGFQVDTDVLALQLQTISRPVTGTTWNMQTVNIPATGTFGVELFGLSNPAIPDLFFLGMPGCGLFASLDFVNAFLVTGSSHAFGLPVPPSPSLVGVHVYASSAVFTNPAINAFGAITSNGLDGLIGDI